MSKRWSRRQILKGVGGAFVTAPFLSSVWEREAKADGDASASLLPKQLIVMFTHYGCVTNWFFPVLSHGPLAASDLSSTTLAPLVPYIDKLLLPRGIRAMNQWTANNDGTNGLGQGNDPDTQACGSYFTCQPVTPNSNNPFSFDPSTKFNAMPIGSSLDNVMAQQISPDGGPVYMRVGNSGGTAGETPQSNVSYILANGAAPGTAANINPGLGNPLQVYSALTGLFQSGGSMTPADYAMVKGQSILDLVADDLATLERVNMSQADRNKLETWKALLSTTAPQFVGPQCTQANAQALGLTSATADLNQWVSNGSLGGDVLTASVTSTMDGADIYSAVAVLATLCGLNPVIVLKYPPNYVFSGLGIAGDAGSLSREMRSSGGSCYPNVLVLLEKIDQYYAQKFTNLVAMLNGVANPDGSTVLDSSAAVWFNQFSDGLAQNLNNLPIVHVGGCGGYFKTGWTINVDPGNPGSPTLTQGNSAPPCNDEEAGAMVSGAGNATGTDPSLANAPINKYFCNLMNALGVMGGDDGFPATGGVGPVTHFGYSDRTQDFCGGAGAVAGATIHNPGEYTEFRA
jgi:hypothetical protein